MKLLNTLILAALAIASCTCETKTRNDKKKQQVTKTELPMRSDAVPKKKAQLIERTELKQKIEKKYGEQWDFCDCVVKGDSINKAFSKPNLPDAEFDRLAKRFDEIDEKCQAFRIQDANRTPEQRDAHEKKVRKCLRDAGVKN